MLQSPEALVEEKFVILPVVYAHLVLWLFFILVLFI